MHNEIWTPLAHQQQQAKTFNTEPTSGDTGVVSVAVAAAIKPQATPGQIVADMLDNRPDASTDYRVVLVQGGAGQPPRIAMVPATTSDGTALSGESLVATVVRDDTTKETSAHTATIDGAFASTPLGDEIDALFASQKPKRNLPALINAILDAYAVAVSDDPAADPINLCFDQTSNGTLKVYTLGSIGTLTGKVGDVTCSPAVSVSTPSRW